MPVTAMVALPEVNAGDTVMPTTPVVLPVPAKTAHDVTPLGQFAPEVRMSPKRRL